MHVSEWFGIFLLLPFPPILVSQWTKINSGFHLRPQGWEKPLTEKREMLPKKTKDQLSNWDSFLGEGRDEDTTMDSAKRLF